MPRLVEFHVAASGDAVAVNPECVVRVGTLVDLEGASSGGTFIRSVDGSTVDVREGYAEVLGKLSNEKG